MDRRSQLDEEDEERTRRRQAAGGRQEDAGGRRRTQEATDIKSNNPHLAGGEIHTWQVRNECMFAKRVSKTPNYVTEVARSV